MTAREPDPSDTGALPGSPQPIPPSAEDIASALQMFDEGALSQAIDELRETGGKPLEAFIAELEQLAQTQNPAG